MTFHSDEKKEMKKLKIRKKKVTEIEKTVLQAENKSKMEREEKKEKNLKNGIISYGLK